MSSAERIVDIDLALERAGGNADLARELYQMLQNELPQYQSKIRRLFESGDFAALTETIHKLNGSATYCGVPHLKVASDTFETNLKRGESARYEEGLSQVLEAISEVMENPKFPL